MATAMDTDDDSDSSSSPMSTYTSVTFKKADGKLLLTESKFQFKASSDAIATVANQAIPWMSIAKHQVSPAKHPKALLKVLLKDGKSCTYLFASRPDLERIRKDISERMQRFKAKRTEQNKPEVATSSSQKPPSTVSSSSAAAGVQQQQQPAEFRSPTSNGARKRTHSMLTPPHASPAPLNLSARLQSGKTTSVSYGELDPTAVAVTRSSLLAANPSLRAQHQYLVTETSTVNEEDFWDTHQDLLEEEYARISGMTRAGTSSLLQSHLQLVTGRVTLGVEEMRQIFILYPAVHKAYEEKVPLELSDEQFWRKYLESEYFHRDRGRVGAASNSGHGASKGGQNGPKGAKSIEEQEARAAAISTDDIFSRYDQRLREVRADETGTKGKRWGTNLAVGQFDLASTFETERGKLLEGPRDNHPPSTTDDGKGSRVIQKYNRHWAMVLHPDEARAGCNLMEVAKRSVKEVLPDDSDAKPGGGEDEEMYRLVDFANAPSGMANHAMGRGLQEDNEYAELTLKNIESYYSAHSKDKGVGTHEKPDEQTMKRRAFFATSMVAKAAKLVKKVHRTKANDGAKPGAADEEPPADYFPPPDLGRELLKALTRKMAEDSKTDADTLEVVNSLPEDFKQNLHLFFRRSSELLRHFFALRRLADSQGSNSANSQKLKNIVQGMKKVYEQMHEMRTELGQKHKGELMTVMQKMCLQIMDQLDCAFKLNRDGSDGGGGGGFVTIESF